MPAWLEGALVAAIVLGAAVFLVGHFTGFTARWRRRGKPDVPVSNLVRRAEGRQVDGSEPPDDGCCR